MSTEGTSISFPGGGLVHVQLVLESTKRKPPFPVALTSF
jgi:hypothetical protein